MTFFQFSQHCFLSHFTPQYPQLACPSTHPQYSHYHICFLCHLFILHNKKTPFKLPILYNKSIADAHRSFLLEEAILYIMLSYVMSCHMSCHAWRVMPCHVISYHHFIYHIVSFCAMLCCVVLCCAVLCCVVLRYIYTYIYIYIYIYTYICRVVMSCHVMLCYEHIVSYRIISYSTDRLRRMICWYRCNIKVRETNIT